ncbi:sorcin-like [Plectropomus leopardus]|uniref:sorcin-like n=1 Tax=Plectropomus leopardus TaxID=160734 RepID=UPI001C4B260E|nr:sorcin-like [Plectropomus leopardus]
MAYQGYGAAPGGYGAAPGGYGAAPGGVAQDPLFGYFSAVAGQDGQISADELQRCLTQAGMSGSYKRNLNFVVVVVLVFFFWIIF